MQLLLVTCASLVQLLLISFPMFLLTRLVRVFALLLFLAQFAVALVGQRSRWPCGLDAQWLSNIWGGAVSMFSATCDGAASKSKSLASGAAHCILTSSVYMIDTQSDASNRAPPNPGSHFAKTSQNFFTPKLVDKNRLMNRVCVGSGAPCIFVL